MFGDSWGSYDSGGSTFGGSYDYSNNFQGPVPYNPFDVGLDFGNDIFAGLGFDTGISGFYPDDSSMTGLFDPNTFDYNSGLFDTNLTVFHGFDSPDTPVTYFNPVEQDPSVFLDPTVVIYDSNSDSWRSLVDQDGNPTDPEIYDGGQLPDFIVRASDELPIAAVQPGESDDMIENPLELTFRDINEAVEQDQGEDQNVFGVPAFPNQGFTEIIRDQLKENAKPLTSDINEFGETVFSRPDGTQYVIRKIVPGGKNKWFGYEQGVTEAPRNGLRGEAEPIRFPQGTTLNPYTGKFQYDTRSEIPTGMDSSTGPLGPGSRITTTYEWDPANPDAGWQVSDRFVLNENEEVMILPENVSLPEPDPVPPDLEEAVDFERPELSPTDLVYEDLYDPTTYEVPQELITEALERIDNDLANSETLGVQFQTLPQEQRETFEELVRGHIENNETFSDSTDINANLNQAFAAAADAVTQELAIMSDDDPTNDAFSQVNAEFIFNDIVQAGGETVEQTLERIDAPELTLSNTQKKEEVQNLFKDNQINNLLFNNFGSGVMSNDRMGPSFDTDSINLNKYNTEDFQNRVFQNVDQLYNDLVKAFPEYDTPSQKESLQKRALRVATIIEVAEAVRADDSIGTTGSDLDIRKRINQLYGGGSRPLPKTEVMAKLMQDGIALGEIQDYFDKYGGQNYYGEGRYTFSLDNGFGYTWGYEMTTNPANAIQQKREQGAEEWYTNKVNGPSLAPADASGFTDYTAGIAEGRQEAIEAAAAQGIQFTQGDIDNAVALATQGLFTDEQQQAAVQAAVTKAIDDTIARGDIFTQAELNAATTLATNNATQAVADAGFVFNQVNIDEAVEQGRLDYINQGYTYRAEDVQTAGEQGYAAGEAAVTASFAEQGIQFTEADITTAVNSAIATKEEEFGITLTEAQRQSALEAVENYKDQGFLYTGDDINSAAESLLENQIQQGFLYRSEDLQDRITQEVNAVTERLQEQFGRDLSAAEIKAAEDAVQAYMGRSDTFTQAEQEAAIQVATDNAVNAYINRDDTYTQEQLNNLVDAGVQAYKDEGYTFVQGDVDDARQTGFTEGQTAGIQTGREQVTTEFAEQGIEFTQADIDTAVTDATSDLFTDEQQQAAISEAVTKAVEDTIARGDIFTQDELNSAVDVAVTKAEEAFENLGLVATQEQLDAAVTQGVQDYQDQGYTFKQEDVTAAESAGVLLGRAEVTEEFEAAGIQFTQTDINTAVTTAMQSAEIGFGKRLTEAERTAAQDAVEEYMNRNDTFTLEEAEAQAEIAASAAVQAYQDEGFVFTQTNLEKAVNDGVQAYKDEGYTFTQDNVDQARQEGIDSAIADRISEGLVFTQSDITSAVNSAITAKEEEFGRTLTEAEAASALEAVNNYIAREDTFTLDEAESKATIAAEAAVTEYINRDDTFNQTELDSAINQAVQDYQDQGYTFTQDDLNTSRQEGFTTGREEGYGAGRTDITQEFEQAGIQFTQSDIDNAVQVAVDQGIADVAAKQRALNDANTDLEDAEDRLETLQTYQLPDFNLNDAMSAMGYNYDVEADLWSEPEDREGNRGSWINEYMDNYKNVTLAESPLTEQQKSEVLQTVKDSIRAKTSREFWKKDSIYYQNQIVNIREEGAAAITQAIEDTIARGDIFTQEELETAVQVAVDAANQAFSETGKEYTQTELDAAVSAGVKNYVDQGYTFTQVDVEAAEDAGILTGRGEVTAEFAQAGIEFTQADIDTAITTAINDADIDGQRQEAARLAVEAYIRDDDTIFTQAELTAAAQAATDAAQAAFDATGQEFTQAELEAAVQNGVDAYKAQGFTFKESDVNTAREDGLAAGIAQQVADFESKGIQFTQADIDRVLLEKENQFGVTLSEAEAAATAKAISDTINRTDIYTQEELNALIDTASQTAVQTYIDSDETIYTEADIQSRITDAINSLTEEELTSLMPEVIPFQPDLQAAEDARQLLKGRREFNLLEGGVQALGKAENQQLLAEWLENPVNIDTYNQMESGLLALGQANADPTTVADAMLDVAINTLTNGGLDPLNALAIGVNKIESITGTNLADIPNVGKIVNDAISDVAPEGLKELVGSLTPGFLRNSLEQATGYLGENVTFVDQILSDPTYAAQVRQGLAPATQQIEEYNKTVFEALFVDPATGEAAISWDSLAPAEKLGFAENGAQFLDDLVTGETQLGDGPLSQLMKPLVETFGLGSDIVSGIGGFLEDVAFEQRKLTGGIAGTALFNTIIGTATGTGPLPYSQIANFLLSPFLPTGQGLSDYLFDRGVNPLTADLSDISYFGGISELADIPEGFFQQDPDFLNDLLAGVTTDQPGFFDPLFGEGTDVSNLLSGETSFGEFLRGLGAGAVGNIFGEGNIDTGSSFFEDDPPGNTVDNPDPEGTPAIFDEFGNPIGGTTPDDGLGDNNEIDTIDAGGNINNNNNNMAEDDNQNTTADAEEFDISYEIAKSLGGSEFAENYRGVGLEGVLGISEDFRRRQAFSSLGTQSALAEEQQGVSDQLRDLNIQSGLDVIGKFGDSAIDAIRSLRPDTSAVQDDVRDLYQESLGRARGELTARDKADARQEAFMLGQATGRTYDPLGSAAFIQEQGNTRRNLEDRALNLGSTLSNFETASTGDVTGFLLNASPFAAGITSVDIPFGGSDLYNIGAQQFSNASTAGFYNEALDRATTNLGAIPNTARPSTVDRIGGFVSDLNTGLNVYDSVFGEQGIADRISNLGSSSSSSSYTNPSSFSPYLNNAPSSGGGFGQSYVDTLLSGMVEDYVEEDTPWWMPRN